MRRKDDILWKVVIEEVFDDLLTEFSDDKIASLANVSEAFVEEVRKGMK
jgi:hypothetical protein